MARINLLPWREELRQERQRQFMTAALATAIVGVLIVFVTGLFFDQAINYQQARNRTIQGEIAKLQVQIRRIEELEQTRARLLSRKQIIENLQASRSLTVEMMDQLAKSIPVGVTLNTVTQQGMNVTLSGTSQSNARVSAYLQALDENDLFVDPDLAFVRVSERDASPVEPYEFSIRVKLRSPQTEDGEMAEGEAMAAAQGGA
ncbi:MAG: PilN domain-containing protein [Gammaproteobacteria bacterium]